MRVLITGMGGELGTRVTQLLEAETSVEALLGLDLYPPRRRLHRAEFRRVDPRQVDRIRDLVAEFAPTALVHLGIYEPYSRSTPTSAIERTAAGTIAIMRAAVDAGALDRVLVRSGIEVYGRRRGAPLRPDEEVPPDPSCGFGHSMLHAERVAGEAGFLAEAPVTYLRLAPVVGPHVPSPLGRLLRLPLVPFFALSDPPFSVVHQDDVAAAFVAALHRGYDGPINVVGPGAVTASQAARLGGRLPVPIIGPAWRATRVLSQLAGAPVPDHVHELLRRGRTADGSLAAEVLGVRATHGSAEAIQYLYAWSDITYLTPQAEVAA